MANTLWDQFEKKDDGKAQCTICKSVLGCRGGTTSGLIKHLEVKHKEQHALYPKAKEEREAAKAGTKRKGSDEGNRDGKKQTKLSFGVPDAALTKKVDKAVIAFLAETGTAFRVVGQP